jgi:ferredoxin
MNRQATSKKTVQRTSSTRLKKTVQRSIVTKKNNPKNITTTPTQYTPSSIKSPTNDINIPTRTITRNFTTISTPTTTPTMTQSKLNKFNFSFTSSLVKSTPSTPSTPLTMITTSTRQITLRTTSISTTKAIKPSIQPLVIPATRPFSTNDDDDHDHGAYERKPPSDPSQAMKITIVDRDGEEHLVDCKVGDNILQLMRIFQERDPKLYLEGACESSLACSTCHVILDQKSYDALMKIKEPVDAEEDLLDMASCLTPTSRLGCQINLVKELDGAKLSLPKFSRNFYVDGHVPQPH